jgi:hypothetical protein
MSCPSAQRRGFARARAVFHAALDSLRQPHRHRGNGTGTGTGTGADEGGYKGVGALAHESSAPAGENGRRLRLVGARGAFEDLPIASHRAFSIVIH